MSISEPAVTDRILDLLQGADDLDICGEVAVVVDEVYDVGAWVQALPDPRVLAWRDKDNGERYVQVSAEHGLPQIRGPVAVWWLARGQHPFWVTLLDGEDLEPGVERELTCHHVLAALARLRIRHPHE
ncbi:MAG: hypothetical protein WA962_14210 [Ornithinimicrobium sp.]